MAKVHIWDRSELVDSVLAEHSISALCGLTKKMTREGIDKAANPDAQVCKGCAIALAEKAKKDGAVVHKAEGWTKLLEQERRERLARSTITIRSVQSWQWPVAG